MGNLGNLNLGKLGLLVTWTLSDLCFWHFGKLGLCIPWVTWTLYTLGNLDFFVMGKPEIFLASAGPSIFLAMGEPYIFFTWGQLVELPPWVTCALGDLCFG